MDSKKFFELMLKMRGQGFMDQSKKDLTKLRIISVLCIILMFLVCGFFPTPFEQWIVGVLLLSFLASFLGAIVGSIHVLKQRRGKWHYVDQVIDWKRVEELAAEQHNSSRT
jgi:hypothetical protein